MVHSTFSARRGGSPVSSARRRWAFACGQTERALQLATEVVSEDKVAPEYQRRQEKPWVSRANRLKKQLAK